MTWRHPHSTRGLRFPRSLLSLLASLLISILSFSIRAQEPEDVVRVRTDLVAVPLVVTDARGRRVSGLNAEDFALLDDARPASIDYFASGTDRVALLFAFDASGSAREIVTQQHEAAMALFSRFGRGSRVAVLHFGETVRLSAGFTSDASTRSIFRHKRRTARQSLTLPQRPFVLSMAAAASRRSGASSC